MSEFLLPCKQRTTLARKQRDNDAVGGPISSINEYLSRGIATGRMGVGRIILTAELIVLNMYDRRTSLFSFPML